MSTETVTGAPTEETSSAEMCAICMDDIAPGNTVRLVPCSHGYCLSCITSWATTQHTCPLCKRVFEGGQHFNNVNAPTEFDGVAFDLPAQKETAPDFSCLDFDFFLAMATRVAANIGEAQTTLFSPSGVFSARGGGTSRTSAQTILRTYQSRLEIIVAGLLEETRFDPEALLTEITLMDRSMQQLWAGNIPSGVLAEDLGDEEDEEEYDDDADDDVHAQSYRPKHYHFNVARQSDHASHRVSASKFHGRKR